MCGPAYFYCVTGGENSMAITIKLLSGALMSSLLGASTAFAANTTWDFSFQGESFSQSNTPVLGVAVGLRIDPPAGFIGQFTSPNGSSTGIFNNDLDSGAGQSFASISQFQTSSATPSQGTWSLNVGQSVYQFTPDFSGVSANSIPSATITSPIADGTTDDQPTFQWALSGTPNAEIVQVSNADFSVDDVFFGLLPTLTSFTMPDALPPGTYNFFLSWSAAVVNVPVAVTHVSGPLLTINPNGTFQSSGEAFESFTVVPEPTGLALLLAAPLILSRRRRAR
jgi:hypothetical protein